MTTYEKPEEHPAYSNSLARACERAYAERQVGAIPIGYYPPCFAVYFDGTAMFVRASSAVRPKDAKLVCIVQHWNGRTVQLRFNGGRSEWRDM